MKAHLLTLTLVTAMFATAANAQTISSTLTADIPFEFMAGTSKLPAGSYDIDTPYPHTIRLRSADRKAAVVLVAHGISTAVRADAWLSFHKYGDKHFLANVRPPASSVGLGLRPSAAEREMSARRVQPETQVVSARRR